MAITDESSDSSTTIAPTNAQVEFIFLECGQLPHGPIGTIVFLSGKFSKEAGLLVSKNTLDVIWPGQVIAIS